MGRIKKRKEKIKKELEALFNEDHSGTVKGREFDRLLRKTGLKK